MGTRNLTVVQLDGKTVVAQYGQWDGYPEGQGSTVLDFLKTIKGPRKRASFEKKLRAASFASSAYLEGVQARVELENLQDTWGKLWPALSRNTGAEILRLIMDTEPGIKLKDSISFAADSLFCEYAYVIDLDKNVLEVYKGFNKKPLPKGARFKAAVEDNVAEGYYPIRLKKTWPLDALPTVAIMSKKVC